MKGSGASGDAPAEDLLSQINADLSKLQLQTTVQVGKHAMAVRLSLFLLVRVLLKILDREGERHVRGKVQQALQYCQKKNREGDPAFRSLAMSIQKLVRTVVGEKRWRQAEMACVVVMSKKKAPIKPQTLLRHRANPKSRSAETLGTKRPSASPKASAMVAQKQAAATAAVSTDPPPAAGMRLPTSPALNKQTSQTRATSVPTQKSSPSLATTTVTSTSANKRPLLPPQPQRRELETKRPAPKDFESNQRQTPTPPPRHRPSSHERVASLPPALWSQVAAVHLHNSSPSMLAGAMALGAARAAGTAPGTAAVAATPPVGPETPSTDTASLKKRQPARHVRIQSTPMAFAPRQQQMTPGGAGAPLLSTFASLASSAPRLSPAGPNTTRHARGSSMPQVPWAAAAAEQQQPQHTRVPSMPAGLATTLAAATDASPAPAESAAVAATAAPSTPPEKSALAHMAVLQTVQGSPSSPESPKAKDAAKTGGA